MVERSDTTGTGPPNGQHPGRMPAAILSMANLIVMLVSGITFGWHPCQGAFVLEIRGPVVSRAPRSTTGYERRSLRLRVTIGPRSQSVV